MLPNMTTEERKIRDKIEKDFTSICNAIVKLDRKQIIVWYGVQSGREWVPYPGGPLYNQSAIEHCKWEVAHLTEFRSLLPKAVRKFDIVIERS